jgi:hypothetical protein
VCPRCNAGRIGTSSTSVAIAAHLAAATRTRRFDAIPIPRRRGRMARPLARNLSLL